MRLAFISPEFVTEPTFSGGLANYLGRVSRALAEAGHDVHVFTRSTDRTTPQLDFHGVTVHRVVPLWDARMLIDHVDPLVPRSHYNFYQDIKAAWCLRRAWKRAHSVQAFDLVQVANVSACGYFFRKERRVPVVTRLSSYRPLWDTLAGAEITRGLKMRWRFEQAAIEGTPYHYAPSSFVADEIVSHYRVEKVDVVETPFFPEVTVADDSVYRAKLEGKAYLLFFGRLTRMKGTHLLAEALPAVLEKHPQLHAVFAGADTNLAPGGGSMRAYLREKNAAYGDRLQLLDPLQHDQLYPIVEHASAVLIPSLADNLPNTCLEAMGLGKLVIAATGSCFEQLITDGSTGFLAPANSAADLSATILKVLSLNADERETMGTRARESLQRLHPSRAIPNLLRYYGNIIDQFGPCPSPC